MSAYRNIESPVVIWDEPMEDHDLYRVRLVAIPTGGATDVRVEMAVERDAMGQFVWVKPSWTDAVINTLARGLASKL